jgi:hypothetical protein
VGIGLGSRALDRPNLLRLVLADGAEDSAGATRWEPLLQQQAQIDDASAEDLAFLQEQLRAAGALEVYSQPVQMKKGRPGTLITVLAPPELAEPLRQVWWQQGSSLGVREQLLQRWALPRQQLDLQTPWGAVRLKRSQRPDGSWISKPEADDLMELARIHQLPLAELRRRVLARLDAGADGPDGAP